jgi:hypothetical protein
MPRAPRCLQMADHLDAQTGELQEQLQQAEATAATTQQDMARLALNVGACIKSAVTTTARLAGLPAPSSSSSYSYLSSLLAPIPPAAMAAARPASAFVSATCNHSDAPAHSVPGCCSHPTVCCRHVHACCMAGCWPRGLCTDLPRGLYVLQPAHACWPGCSLAHAAMATAASQLQVYTAWSLPPRQACQLLHGDFVADVPAPAALDLILSLLS